MRRPAGKAVPGGLLHPYRATATPPLAMPRTENPDDDVSPLGQPSETPRGAAANGWRPKPDSRKAPRREGIVTDVIAAKDIAWAARQGTNDRNAGTGCRKYKNFLNIYKLPRSPFTLRMWNAYLLARRATPQKAARAGDRRERLIQAGSATEADPGRSGPRLGCAPRALKTGRAGKLAGATETFLRIYKLHKSDASRHVWNIYHQHAKPAPLNTSPPKPMQKSRWTRGLSLSDASILVAGPYEGTTS